VSLSLAAERTSFARFRRSVSTRLALVVAGVIVAAVLLGSATAAVAQIAPTPPTAPAPTMPTPSIPLPTGVGTDTTAPAAQLNVNLDGLDVSGGTAKKGNQTITLLLLLTVLSIAPSIIMMTTSFTRIVVVLSITRNAIGLQMAPPNQVVVGLSLFLTFFVMSPTLSEINKTALQPVLKGEITNQQAYKNATIPLRAFMLKQTGQSELALFVNASGAGKPTTPEKTPLTSLIPAFVLSELKAAFIIGFVIMIPFLVIDLIVSSSLMSMGMFMLPPVLVSLPFKLMLFVLVDGWGLVVQSLLKSFNT
jgi:flagellar biosynthetic protein FliP